MQQGKGCEINWTALANLGFNSIPIWTKSAAHPLRHVYKHQAGNTGSTTHTEDHTQEEQGPLLWDL